MILIAGPCVIESEKLLFEVAEKLKIYHEDSDIDFYFKSSFDKGAAVEPLRHLRWNGKFTQAAGKKADLGLDLEFLMCA